jgi:hypothetical protein
VVSIAKLKQISNAKSSPDNQNAVPIILDPAPAVGFHHQNGGKRKSYVAYIQVVCLVRNAIRMLDCFDHQYMIIYDHA